MPRYSDPLPNSDLDGAYLDFCGFRKIVLGHRDRLRFDVHSAIRYIVPPTYSIAYRLFVGSCLAVHYGVTRWQTLTPSYRRALVMAKLCDSYLPKQDLSFPTSCIFGRCGCVSRSGPRSSQPQFLSDRRQRSFCPK